MINNNNKITNDIYNLNKCIIKKHIKHALKNSYFNQIII